MALSAQDIAAFHATSLPQAQVAPKTVQKKGNFLTSLIPTVGGTGGALAGAAAGATLGSVVPIVGTAAGGLLGALLGGAAGGAAGKVAENKVEHQALGNGVMGAGIENGVLSAGPLRLLKAGKVGAVAAKEGASSLLGALAKPVAADAGGIAEQTAAQPLRTSIAGKLDSFGNNQLAKQWGTLDKPTIRSTNPAKTVGTLANMGITKPQDAERIAQGLTGSNGVVNKAVVSAVGKSGSVPVSNVGTVLDQAITDNGLVGNDAASIRKVVEGQMGKLGTDSTANPTQVMGVMKSIEQRIANLSGRGDNYHMPTPERLDQARALKSVHDELQNSLYKSAGADANIASVMTPGVRQQLLDLHPGNNQWQKFVDGKVMNAKTIGDLRSAQAPFVNASKMINNAEGNSFSMGGKIGNALNASSLKGTAVNMAANLVKDPAQRALGLTAKKLSSVAPGAVNGTATDLAAALAAPSKKAIIRNEVLGNTLTGSLGADQGASAQGTQPDPTTQSQMIQPSQQMLDPSLTAQPQNNSPFNPTNVEANLTKIMANGGKLSDAEAYLSLVKTLNDLQGGAAQKPLTSTQQQQAFNAQSGLQSLGDIAAALQAHPNEAKLAALPGGSLTSSLTGTGSYKAAIANAADVIGRLRSGGAIGQEEEKQFKALLPQTFDTPKTATYKLSQLQQLFSQFANPQAASSTDLLTALGGQ